MELAEQIDDSTFCTLTNNEAPTRIMGTCNSSPDITIASGGLINSITWRPMLTLASDHLPMIAAATARFIPAGRVADLRHSFPAGAAVLANERDPLRHADPCYP